MKTMRPALAMLGLLVALYPLTVGASPEVSCRGVVMRPGDTWGARDHYVWTPDAKRIVSYFCQHPIQPWLDSGKPFNHFAWEWWLSATDWRTGEDLAAMYPPGRWGGHMQVSPDSLRSNS